MKRIAVLGLCIALVAFGYTPGSAGSCPGLDFSLQPLGYQQVAVSTTAVGLTLPSGVVRMAVITVEDNPIRFRDDGTNPSSTVGVLVQPDVTILVCGPAVSGFRAIRTGADAKLSVSYYGDLR